MAIKEGRVSLLLDMSGFEIAREGRVSLVLGNKASLEAFFVPMQCVWQFFSIWSGQKLTPGKFAVLPILGNYLQSGSNSSRLSETPPCLSLKSCEGFIMFIWTVLPPVVCFV